MKNNIKGKEKLIKTVKTKIHKRIKQIKKILYLNYFNKVTNFMVSKDWRKKFQNNYFNNAF